jgi:hypothetical protein
MEVNKESNGFYSENVHVIAIGCEKVESEKLGS